MSQFTKRQRQTTIAECFYGPKRERNASPSIISKTKMATLPLQEKQSKENMRELLASAAEKRIAACSNSPDSEDTEIDESELSETQSSQSFNNSEELFDEGDDWLSLVVMPSEEENVGPEIEEASVSKLKRVADCQAPVPKLEPTEEHTLLFRPYIIQGCSPRPFPDEFKDQWDGDHVRMPCSPQNRFPVESSVYGIKSIQKRWDIICHSLTRKMDSSLELEKAIIQYNRQYQNRWDFLGLHSFFNLHLVSNRRQMLLNYVIPGMKELAFQLPHICTKPIPLLKKNTNHSITLSQKQIACLLANAFFCTFPRRNHFSRLSRPTNAEYSNYPHINFNRLFVSTKGGICQRNREKLKCIFNYFQRVVQKEPTGTVTFRRQCLKTFPKWSASDKNITEAVICANGFIETQGHGMLQVDFANRFVGGGVLSQGCVQEEIRFVISPELIVSRLFTESLSDSEALIVTGVEQYSKYTGYSDTFLFDGDFKDDTPRDSWGRRRTQVVAIDALHYNKATEQFKPSLMIRELNKAYAGFYDENTSPENLAAVATGNWGCGAFRGSVHLKFLIQLMAVSEVGRGMLYFTFGNQKLQQELNSLYEFLLTQELTVGGIWTLIEMYSKNFANEPEERWPNLFDFIYNTCSCDSNSDSNVASHLDKSSDTGS